LDESKQQMIQLQGCKVPPVGKSLEEMTKKPHYPVEPARVTLEVQVPAVLLDQLRQQSPQGRRRRKNPSPQKQRLVNPLGKNRRGDLTRPTVTGGPGGTPELVLKLQTTGPISTQANLLKLCALQTNQQGAKSFASYTLDGGTPLPLR
jgi:hypothetical protein